MINEIDKDLLLCDVDAVAHCANCFCTMGSGIARQIKLQFPEAYQADLKTVSGDKSKLGKFSMARVSSDKTPIKFIYNLYGQYFYGKDSRKLNYEAIYTAMESMRNDCMINGIKSVGFPKNMGCMLAGGNWNIVFTMIEEIYKDFPISVLICNYKK